MLEQSKVVVHERVGDPRYQIMRLVLRTAISLEAKPGQFVHVQVATGLDPLLRRPISIAEINPQNQEITLLYRIRGKGTERLAQVNTGEVLSLLGPVGTGFTLPDQGELVLVAGGIGAFPLLALARKAKERDIPVRLLWGGESRGFLESAGLSYWEQAEIPVEVCTLDGSLGEKGNVLDLIKKNKALTATPKKDSASPASSVATCGPNPMMQAVSEYLLEQGYPVEVSLEERMGCAVGACLGCVCTLKDGQSGKIRRAKVCKDGPVFNAREVLWNDTI